MCDTTRPALQFRHGCNSSTSLSTTFNELFAAINTISILRWNIRGFHSRKPCIQSIIDTTKPDIICLQETHLKPKSSAYLSQYHFPPNRQDRLLQRDGGVAIFIKNSLPAITIPHQIPLELTITQLLTPTLPVNIASLYLTPDITAGELLPHLDPLLELLKPRFILCADVNAHHPLWGSTEADRRGNDLYHWIEENDLVIINTGEPTFLSSSGKYTHIDVTICSLDLASRLFWHPHHDPMTSDHFPIIISTTLPSNNAPQIEQWKLHSANWSQYQKN